ncbi:nanos homolog 1-like [Eucyclogobius newberryi]|uniref:nanos homolog 1-like n=1 Tax=Eucyclogobius newberryi TaxID=166745 RepID=UPI003B5CC54A
MDLLERGYLDSPYNYTFNFWNDYLGLSTLVAQNKPTSPNSITESLKATLGLDDAPTCCPCAVGHGRGGGDGHGECYCCAPPSSPPPLSIYELKESLLHRPYHHERGDSPLSDPECPGYRGGGGGGGAFGCGGGGGLDLLARRKHFPRCKPEPKVCVFCRNNGAPEEVYGTHILKTADGRVLCPILRAYTCPLCSANGDNAHTIKYCPLSRDQHRGASKAGRAVGKRLKIF